MTRTDVASLGTLLGVWAHPDDEAFLTAGLMLLARRAGNRVVCVTATLGEHGTDRPDEWPPHRLGPLRAREHRASLQVLGVEEPIVLGYTDGTCDRVAVAEGAARLAEIIEAVQPDTVVTFGPDGMTGHPDHVAVSTWISCALDSSAYPARLLHAAVTPQEMHRQRSTSEALGAFGPGLPVTTPPSELALRLTLDEDLLDHKLAALRAHASQTRGQEERVGTAAYRRWQQEEAFVAAARSVVTPC
ncbi:MAG TPA: PIG-L family deacetylase [Jatrophihabitans sp.]|nr:PIG-L family deacetylase [Jatrophihabitans sp.]